MKVKLNGLQVDLEGERLSVSELLTRREVASPDMVSVQLNGVIVERDRFDDTLLKEDDTVEFLYFMGGGDNGA